GSSRTLLPRSVEISTDHPTEGITSMTSATPRAWHPPACRFADQAQPAARDPGATDGVGRSSLHRGRATAQVRTKGSVERRGSRRGRREETPSESGSRNPFQRGAHPPLWWQRKLAGCT